jgi:uncharacterized protein
MHSRSCLIRRVVMVFTLISLRALPTAAQGTSPQEQLWDAAIRGDTAAMATALGRGAAIDSLDTRGQRNGRRTLNWAAWHNHGAAIRFLVARGANINLPNLTGHTPLHHAAEHRSVEAVRVLVALGADRELRNRFGRRPIDLARFRDYAEIVALLEPRPRQ